MGRPVCEGRHVEVATEADLCGVEAVRVTVNTYGLWGMWSSCGGRRVELSWRPVCGGQSMEANGRCRLMEAGVCERQ